MSRRRVVLGAAAGLAAVVAAGTALPAYAFDGKDGSNTTTPINHLVVIYQENVSFDHYFATYPQATNQDGEPRFVAAPQTPSVNGLGDSLTNGNNPNSTQPFRLDRSQAHTCDQGHGYTQEQQAFDSGLMDMFPETTGSGDEPDSSSCGKGTTGGQVMGYYDGNTVTAMWNYAQHYAMSDNSFSTTFGPSTPGALNLVSGQTHGFSPDANPLATPPTTSGSAVTANQTVIGDPQPAGDKCDSRDQSTSVDPNNKNVGDLLNVKKVTWGWFQGGFDNCAQSHIGIGNTAASKDYIPHHEPFQYYKSTQNLQHLPPTSDAMVGKTDQANHQYDLARWYTALDQRNLPEVSFLKAPAYQDGHAGYSDPLDEQTFLVNTINKLQKSPYWKDTAVVIAYDDSDGWYDHQMSPIVNQSQDSSVDKLTGANCGTKADPQRTLGTYQDRCGYGPRQPLLVISPFAKSNFVDHTVTDQTSILRFIEDNWQTGKIGNYSFDTKADPLTNMFDFGSGGQGHGAGPGQFQLDPASGQPVSDAHE